MKEEPVEVTVGPRGRIVVPAELRRKLGVEPDSVLLARVDGDRPVLETRRAALDRLRALFAHVPPDGDLRYDERLLSWLLSFAMATRSPSSGSDGDSTVSPRTLAAAGERLRVLLDL